MLKNVTSLNIIKLSFSFCGARFPSNFIVYPHDFETLLKIPSTKLSQVTLYFLQTINVTISEVAISNSIGAGLPGVNMLGVSNILHSKLSGNKPNCLLMFLDMPSMSDIILPTVLSIKEVQATLGSRPHQKGHQYHNTKYATGLSIKLVQTTYNVRIYINNITIYENSGMQDGWHGNLHIAIENWKCHCSVIQAKQITSTNAPRRYDTATLWQQLFAYQYLLNRDS